MRPLGPKEIQRHNLPCRASPAECHPERREFLSRPFHNFLAGRHLWFGPLRSPRQHTVVQPPIGCCSENSKTFACDMPPAVLLASDLEDAARMPLCRLKENFRKWLKTGAFRGGI